MRHQASISVPSTEKCSLGNSRFTRCNAWIDDRKRPAISPSSNRSRFFEERARSSFSGATKGRPIRESTASSPGRCQRAPRSPPAGSSAADGPPAPAATDRRRRTAPPAERHFLASHRPYHFGCEESSRAAGAKTFFSSLLKPLDLTAVGVDLAAQVYRRLWPTVEQAPGREQFLHLPGCLTAVQERHAPLYALCLSRKAGVDGGTIL